MSDAQPSAIAWKVFTAKQFAALKADGTTEGAPVDRADGFIHLSTLDQLEETLAKHFAGEDNLYLVCIDLDVLGDTIRWEPARSRGGAPFPHVYAPLPLSAAIAYGPLERETTGELRLPVAG